MASKQASARTAEYAELQAQGFLAPLRWARPAQADSLLARLLELCDAEGTEMLHNPHLSHDWLYDIIASAPIIRFLSGLLGNRIAVENVFVIVKYPGDGLAVPPHQDGINGSIELDRTKAIAVWYALTDANSANGCVETLRKSGSPGVIVGEVMRVGVRVGV
jgi:hypothetical protein